MLHPNGVDELEGRSCEGEDICLRLMYKIALPTGSEYIASLGGA